MSFPLTDPKWIHLYHSLYPPLYRCHFHLLFISRWFIILLMVSPLSLIVNTAPNCFHPHATAVLSPSSQSTYIFLVVTCSQIKSLHPSRLLRAGGHRFKCEKLQLSASQGKCEKNIYGLIAKKMFTVLMIWLWCCDAVKHFLGTVLSKCCSYVDSIYICNHSGYPIRPTEESVQVL